MLPEVQFCPQSIMETALLNLPDHLTTSILQLLSPEDLCRLSECNTLLWRTCRDNELWRTIYSSTWPEDDHAPLPPADVKTASSPFYEKTRGIAEKRPHRPVQISSAVRCCGSPFLSCPCTVLPSSPLCLTSLFRGPPTHKNNAL